ncbi:hypothetical protein [Aurantiacibacter poecillastricola]|nr:hypothetical protein [Aurantiacibacter sp. 219JJ12-13]MDP5260190.1 hypothetical protein [Aurantiacibacter sp. 219JJ12-13]
MPKLLNNTLAAFAALVIALSSLSAITTVPMQESVAVTAPLLA